ncbi:MAG: Rne/Rng family ribonuclease [Clostridia bacterium]|nr:Rne/Rng family ribonuclease [Clostridia bacterium]
MLELIINKREEKKEIALLENGKLREIYTEEEEENKNEGNIYIGIVRDILPGMQAAFVDIGTEKNSFIHIKDILPQVDQKVKQESQEQDIKKIIKVNDKLLVQVKKDSNEKKGARTSTHIGLPSTLIILMPRTEIVTISRKIEDDKERERLLKIAKESLPQNMGVVVRTSAVGKTKEEIEQDINKKIDEWKKIEEKYNQSKQDKPQLLYTSASITEKIIIDIAYKDLENIIVNDKKEYEEIEKIIKKEKNIKAKINIELKENEDLFSVYDIQRQNEKSENRKVWLNCGGFITIDKTEALTAIDVNTGKFTGNKSLEETVYKVNQEATIEIANQLRLRDIGGIIIIDYIDMKNKENKQKIEALLKKELKNDRAKTQVEGFTKLDLMELTRKHICSHKD